MVLLEGLKIANQIKEEIAETVTKMKEAGQKVPHLAAVLVGEDGASLTYVGSKVRSCQKIGFESTLIKLPQEVTEEDLAKDMYILECSDAQENILEYNDWFIHQLHDGWTVASACSKWGVNDKPSKKNERYAVHGGYLYQYAAECASGNT